MLRNAEYMHPDTHMARLRDPLRASGQFLKRLGDYLGDVGHVVPLNASQRVEQPLIAEFMMVSP